MNVIFNGEAISLFESVADDVPEVMNWVVAEVSLTFAEYIRKTYLRGRAMNYLSGQTYESVKFFKKKDNQMGVRPGVGVRGSLNYLHRFIGTEHEFMQPAYKDWASTNQAGKEAHRLFDKWLESRV
jgi:hypothetical protein